MLEASAILQISSATLIVPTCWVWHHAPTFCLSRCFEQFNNLKDWEHEWFGTMCQILAWKKQVLDSHRIPIPIFSEMLKVACLPIWMRIANQWHQSSWTHSWKANLPWSRYKRPSCFQVKQFNACPKILVWRTCLGLPSLPTSFPGLPRYYDVWANFFHHPPQV